MSKPQKLTKAQEQVWQDCQQANVIYFNMGSDYTLHTRTRESPGGLRVQPAFVMQATGENEAAHGPAL